MADVGPNWKAEQLKLYIGVKDLETKLIRSELEIVEAENKVKIAKNNIKAAHEAIADGKERLAALIKEHGDLIKGVNGDG